MNPQEIQLKQFLHKIDYTFNEYGDVNYNALYDSADVICDYFINITKDNLDELEDKLAEANDELDGYNQEYKDVIAENKKYEDAIRVFQDKLDSGKLSDADIETYNERIEDFNFRLENNIAWIKEDYPEVVKQCKAIIEEYTDLKKVVDNFINNLSKNKPNNKKILDNIFFNESSQFYINIDDIANRVSIINLSSEYNWITDWVYIYLEQEYDIKTNADFVRAVLEQSIDLDLTDYFDEDAIRKLAKTSAGKTFLNHYFAKA